MRFLINLRLLEEKKEKKREKKKIMSGSVTPNTQASPLKQMVLPGATNSLPPEHQSKKTYETSTYSNSQPP